MRRYLDVEPPEKGAKEVGIKILAEDIASGDVFPYPSQSAAAAACGVSVASVSKVSRGLCYSVKGWKFLRV